MVLYFSVSQCILTVVNSANLLLFAGVSNIKLEGGILCFKLELRFVEEQ